jgi:hypothetical protein
LKSAEKDIREKTNADATQCSARLHCCRSNHAKPSVWAKAAQPSTPVNFEIPAGACDCHTHIHGDVEKFPFFAGRVYTPEPASPEEMSALQRR